MGIKIGNIDASYFKVGSGDCSIYLGDTKLYPTEEPTFTGKFKAWYNDGTTYTAACDSSSALTTSTTRAHTTSKTYMTKAIVGDCITEIGNSAFYQCSMLSAVTMPSSITKINDSAFAQCSKLSNIEIPSSVTTILGSAFYKCSSLESIVLPNSIKSLYEQYIFYQCTSLKTVVLPNELTRIGGSMFNFCTSLSSITIPNTVTRIGSYAFYGCNKLQTLVLPSSLTQIDAQCFRLCTGLTSITVNAITPPTLGSMVFDGTNDCPIYVPCSSVDAYKSATNWSSYASRIQGIPPCASKQWVYYTAGDDIPSDDNICGIRVDTFVAVSTFEITFMDSDENTFVFGYDSDSDTWYGSDDSYTDVVEITPSGGYATYIFSDNGLPDNCTIDSITSDFGDYIPCDLELYQLTT